MQPSRPRFCALTLLLLLPLAATAKEITHEDIKDAMLSLVHLMRDNTDKLERHEARDRQTDEQLKKAVVLLSKRLAGAEGALDERLARLERLGARGEEALDGLTGRLGGWASELQLAQQPLAEELRALAASHNLSRDALTVWLGDDGQCATLGRLLRTELQELGQAQALLLPAAEQLLDGRKRLEHAHRMLRELAELVLAQGQGLNASLSSGLEALGAEMKASQERASAQLSSSLETEMERVWRQINLMHARMAEGALGLERLQQQGEAFVNGSTGSLDAMQGKLGLITKRMSEVDDNLNYLLGRLSLVTQEFGQVKQGLGEALGQLKASFAEVQREAGPHPLPPGYEQPTTSERP